MEDELKDRLQTLVNIACAGRDALSPKAKRDIADYCEALASLEPGDLVVTAAMLFQRHFALWDVAKEYIAAADDHKNSLTKGIEAADSLLRLAPAHYQKEYASARGRHGAHAKLARDPKQSAKAEAFMLWRERYAGKHPKLRTNEQFAAECMRRWPELTSAKVILGWCTGWNKAAKARKPQPAS